jgi:hypothetical protein
MIESERKTQFSVRLAQNREVKVYRAENCRSDVCRFVELESNVGEATMPT